MKPQSRSSSVLVTMASGQYVDQAKQLFSSVYFNSGWTQDLLLLACDIPEKQLDWFRSRNIQVKQVKYSKHTANQWFPEVYLSVFEVFTPFFKKWKNVVFIESDVIVQSGLDALTEVSGFYAVQNIAEDKLRNHFLSRSEILFGLKKPTLRISNTSNISSSLRKLNELEEKFVMNDLTFNAGVFVFSTDIIDSSMSKKLFDLAEEYAEISTYGLQGVLNLFFNRRWKKLPFLYNYCYNSTGFGTKNKIRSRLAPIVHFAGIQPSTDKPWNDSQSLYFTDWNSNLKNADKIYLKPPKKSFQHSIFHINIIAIPYIILFNLKKLLYKKKLFILSLINSAYYKKIKMLGLLILNNFKRKVVNCALVFQLIIIKSKNKKILFEATHVYYIVGTGDAVSTVFSILSLNNFIPGLQYRIYFDQKNSLVKKFLVNRLLNKLIHVEILDQAIIEENIIAQLENYPYARAFFNFGWSGKKFFIPLFLEKKGSSILIDSDTLFTAKPQEIIDWLKNSSQKMLFLSDYSNFSAISFIESDYILGRKHSIEFLNSGLLLFPLNEFHKHVSLTMIDKYIEQSILLSKQRTYFDFQAKIEMSQIFPIIEQTLHTLIAEHLPHSRLDKNKYQVFPEHSLRGKDVSQSCFMHFTGDIKRIRLYRYLFSVLIQKIKNVVLMNEDIKEKSSMPWFIASRDLCIRCFHPEEMREVA